MAVPVARLAALKMAEKDKTWAIALAGAGFLGVAGLVSIYFLTKGPSGPPGEAEEGEWAAAHWELAKAPFSIEIRQPEVGDWRPAHTVLASMPFSVQIGEPEVGDWRPANAPLASMPFSVQITEVAALQSPQGETLLAQNITDKSATIFGRLIDTGYWSNVDVYFEWGETTTYGQVTSKHRMYDTLEGQAFQAELTGLKAGTTYHFRAVVEAVGYRSGEVGPGYGADMTFATPMAPVVGFTMRVANPPAGAEVWMAGDGEVSMDNPQPFSYTWHWAKPVPGYMLDFLVGAYGPATLGGSRPVIYQHEFPFLLRDGKNYVYDFAIPPWAQPLREI